MCNGTSDSRQVAENRELVRDPPRPKMPFALGLPQVMSSIASVLKDENSRITCKEVRRETSSLKKSSAAYRSETAALKRRVLELERQLRRVGRGGRRPNQLQRTKTPPARHSLQREEHDVSKETT